MKVQAVYNNKLFKKGLEFAAENGALFSGTVSLALSTVARPLAILATPNTDAENKKYACAKSLSSSAVGYLLMLCASMPVAKSIKKIDERPAKYLKARTVKSLKNGADSLLKSKSYNFATQLFKLGIGFLIAVPKSIMTCALIPPFMAKLFPKKEQEKNEKRDLQKTKVVSFTGKSGIEYLSKGIGRIIDMPSVQKMSNKFHNTNFEQHIMSMTDGLITASFIHQTHKSKRIEENRKKPLMYNAAISTGLCIAGGYALNRALKKPFDKFVDKFCEVNKNSPKLEKYVEGLRIAKPALILGGIYYIVIPLISTFLADRIDRKNTKLFS